MIEFTHNGFSYRAERLPAMQQLHISRRIAPLLPPLIPIFVQIARDRKDAEKGKGDGMASLDSLATLFQPFADSLASMEDKDAEYVISTCLSVVSRKGEKNDVWTRVWVPAARASAFDDLNQNAAELWVIVLRVLQDSLGPFIQGILTSQQEALSA